MNTCPEIIDKLRSDEIFVFGSNTEGRHGAGAARAAVDKFGAKMGQASGLQGQSYAIVTKDLSKGERSIHLELIEDDLVRLFEYARLTPGKKFFLTPIGTGLAGYTIEEIALLISDKNVPDNVYVSELLMPSIEALRKVSDSEYLPSLKDLISRDTKVEFDFFREGIFYYSVASPYLRKVATLYAYRRFRFPVPQSDVGNATMLRRDKSVFFMRWVRKALENGELVEVKEAQDVFNKAKALDK